MTEFISAESASEVTKIEQKVLQEYRELKKKDDQLPKDRLLSDMLSDTSYF